MKPHERARAAGITRVIEIGRQARDNHHGRAESRQAPATGARERQRSKRVCEGFHFILRKTSSYGVPGVTIESASGTIRNAIGSGPTGSPST